MEIYEKMDKYFFCILITENQPKTEIFTDEDFSTMTKYKSHI